MLSLSGLFVELNTVSVVIILRMKSGLAVTMYDNLNAFCVFVGKEDAISRVLVFPDSAKTLLR